MAQLRCQTKLISASSHANTFNAINITHHKNWFLSIFLTFITKYPRIAVLNQLIHTVTHFENVNKQIATKIVFKVKNIIYLPLHKICSNWFQKINKNIEFDRMCQNHACINWYNNNCKINNKYSQLLIYHKCIQKVLILLTKIQIIVTIIDIRISSLVNVFFIFILLWGIFYKITRSTIIELSLEY